ncbi:alpha/beta fold hydrolase [Paraburkholderia sp. CNPSo 3157]|uniref:Alpha/beta fold hydrolase n=1 Tax=Paraburkholderia franconis TaxID=2654983 RepID=A0A7X1TGG1_9BURK|nr:alpha/beta hydrolase [Paraburkholderia franconis]MPW18343.1 alpha/beta fold hydrolase [Paraburkholderia franconis]
MTPVVFDDCFGWLHPAQGGHGVVLCNPFGYDTLCTHRGWRALAQRLSAAGMPVLRFDYPGAGDSAGVEEDVGRIDAWIASIASAVQCLRERTGVERVSLCGLRLGATLAALAAQRIGDIDGLVMLSPVVLGKSYIRELRAHRQGWLSTPAGINAVPIPDNAAYVEAFGFGLHGDDIAQLAAVDLRNDTRSPARRVLIFESSDRARLAALAQHYIAHGVEVERQPFEEADRFLIEALYSVEPVQAFAAVTTWFAAGGSAERRDAPVAPVAPVAQMDRAAACEGNAWRCEEPMLRLTREGASEYPVVFGDYFGIHCKPDGPRADAPAVLFVNTGASHHIGDGRIFVLFARLLAAQGIASLRMDLGGLGDSSPTAPHVDLDTIYADQSPIDAMAGADWLIAQGHSRIVAFGVCGGAFVSLHACARHPQIVGCYGVNLQKFIWDGIELTEATAGLAPSAVLRRSALSVEKWKRVLHGESSLMRVLRGLSTRFARSAGLRAAEWVRSCTGISLSKDDVHDLMRKLHDKGANVRLAYGEFDLGIEELKIQFGSRLRALRRYPGVRTMTLPRLDHALFTREAREAAITGANQWLFDSFVEVSAVRGRSGSMPREDAKGDRAAAAVSVPTPHGTYSDGVSS